MLDLMHVHFLVLWKRGRFLSVLLFITLLASMIGFLIYYRVSPVETYNKYENFFLILSKGNIGTIRYFMLYLIPLIVPFVEGDSGIVEWPMRFQIESKCNRNEYYRTKAMAVFTSGFIILFYFISLLILFEYIMTTPFLTRFVFGYYPINNFSTTFINFPNLLQNFPLLYRFFYAFLFGIWGGLIAVTSYILGLYVRSKVLAYIGPFFISIIFSIIVNILPGFLKGFDVQTLLQPDFTRPIFGLAAHESGIFYYFIVSAILLIISLELKLHRRTERKITRIKSLHLPQFQRSTIVTMIIYLSISILVTLFFKQLKGITISEFYFSYPKVLSGNPINIITIISLIFWIAPDFVLIAIVFHRFVKFQKRVALYVVTRSPKTWKYLGFILARIFLFFITLKLIRAILIGLIWQVGALTFIDQGLNFMASIIIPWIAFEILCLSYLYRKDERHIAFYFVVHLFILLILISTQSFLLKYFIYQIPIENFESILFGILIIGAFFVWMTKSARKVEY